MLDLFPTFCEAAGIDDPGDVDGRSIMPLLTAGDGTDRDAVFTVFHETWAKRRFEMRCSQDALFGYIWNQWSDGDTEYVAENMEGETWPGMLAAADDDPTIARRVAHYRYREPEELYDLAADPDCLLNLAGDTRYAPVLARYRDRLAAWMEGTRDPLAATFEAEVLASRSRRGRPD